MATRTTFGGAGASATPGELQVITLDTIQDYGPWDVKDYQSFSLQMTGGSASEVAVYVSNNPDPAGHDAGSDWLLVSNTWRVHGGPIRVGGWAYARDWMYGSIEDVAYLKLYCDWVDDTDPTGPTTARLLFSQAAVDRVMADLQTPVAQIHTVGGTLAYDNGMVTASVPYINEYNDPTGAFRPVYAPNTWLTQRYDASTYGTATSGAPGVLGTNAVTDFRVMAYRVRLTPDAISPGAATCMVQLQVSPWLSQLLDLTEYLPVLATAQNPAPNTGWVKLGNGVDATNYGATEKLRVNVLNIPATGAVLLDLALHATV